MDDLEIDRRIRAALAELEPQDLELPRPETIRRRAIGRRRRMRWTPMVALAVATALIAGLLYVRSGSGTALRTGNPPGPSPAEGSATVADLAAGHWSQLPPDPVAPPSAMIWAGSELLAWGNTTGAPPVTVDFTKGAAYHPSSQRWKAIAPAPFPVPQGQSIWTGTEVLFLGTAPGGKGSDAAAYSPRANRWRRLPRSPLESGTQFAVWTGERVMALGTIGTGSGAPAGVASYDPSTNRWTTIALPKPPVEHGIRWESAVAIGGSVLAWSGWQITSTGGPALAGHGTDLYAYEEVSGRWSLRQPTGTPLPAAYSEFWTGSAVLVDGPAIDCYNCGPGGPPVADVVGSYDPAGNRWIPVPSVMSPAGFTWGDPSLVWTGGALVAFGAGNPSPVRGYDPAANQWQDLPSIPGQSCLGAHLWTGNQLIWSCNGVALALTPAAPAIPSPPPAGASPLPPGTAPCQARQLKATGTWGAGPGDQQNAMAGGIALQNNSRTPCSLQGQPTVHLAAQDGTTLAVEESPIAAGQAEPGVLLSPGEDVGAVIAVGWSNWCGASPGSTTLSLTIEGGGSVTVTPPIDVTPACDNPGSPSAFDVGYFVP